MRIRDLTSRWRARVTGISRAAFATALMSALVVIAMVVAAIALRQAADSHRRAQVLAERVQASTQEMSALKWRANTLVLAGRADLSWSGGLVRNGLRILTGLNNETSELARLQPDRNTLRLKRDVDQLVAGSYKGLEATATSKSRHSMSGLEQIQTDFQPLLDRMDEDAGRAADDQQRVARSSLQQLLWASIGSILLGIGLLAVLGARFTRLRRRAVLAEKVRSVERRSEQRIRALVEQASDVVTVLDRELRVRWQAASIQGLLGLPPGSLLESPIIRLVHPDDAPAFRSFLLARLDGGPPATRRLRLHHADGRWIHVETVAEDRCGDPAVEGLVLNMRDISERIDFEDQLRHQAFHDSLTGLANRALFEDRLRHALAARLRTQTPLAVLFLDLDDFKTINDSLGHGAGDALLQSVASRIDPLVRPTDTSARLGGDEFAVLLDDVESIAQAEEIAERILAAIRQPLAIEDHELTMTGSIGIALSAGSIDADELLRNADVAMYAAKAAGKDSARAFEYSMHRSALERLELRAELPRALERHELRLQYQPIVSLQGRQLVGVEALVRWQHPRRGLLGPDEFIPLAEETGVIVPLGRWVLEQACAQARSWQLAAASRPSLYISVNVSVRQLHDDGFPACVAEILHRTELPAQSLVLEITEGMLAHDRQAIVRRLKALKRLGLRIAVDDFGTGYSALSHLQQFPIDILKIDKSFIDEIHTSSQKANLVQGIINLGQSLELDVIAEGIEDAEQADRLRAMHSPLAQGFFFSRPIEPDEILHLLVERHGRTGGSARGAR